MLYFAYGSNMDLAAMTARCPHSKMLKATELPGYKLAYRGPLGQVYLTLIPEIKATVQGLLFDIADSDWQALDDYEDYPALYGKSQVSVSSGEKAVVYLMNEKYASKMQHKPHPDYVAQCEQATVAAGLDPANIKAAAAELFAATAEAFHVDNIYFNYGMENSYEVNAGTDSETQVEPASLDGATGITALSTASDLIARGESGNAMNGEAGAPLLKENNFTRKWTLKGINLEIKDGAYICIVGPNGSGKSTLIRHLNALLLPLKGKVSVYGIDSRSDDDLFELRRKAGMVFQNPDNQIIGTTVAEDMAFGPENLGIPANEIRQRIKAVLELLHLEAFRDREPGRLSGGQKQKVAIAGILTMNPRAVLLDEATSMLDPLMRDEFLDFLDSLRRSERLTVVHVTHHLDEVVRADHVVLLDKGEKITTLTPSQLFRDAELLKQLELELPGNYALWQFFKIIKGETDFTYELFNEETVIKDLLRLLVRINGDDLPKIAENIALLKAEAEVKKLAAGKKFAELAAVWPESSERTGEEIVVVKDLSYSYKNGDTDKKALDAISFTVKRGEFLAIVGPTGSGKSTLVMHLNALIESQPGKVFINDIDVSSKARRKELRRQVAMLFQYPEHQLFAETVYKDIAFGPEKLGYSEEKVASLTNMAAALVGLDEQILDKSPFELSGGQMRRVALAGIIAMQAELFVLDEPAAGLDDRGRKEIFSYIKLLQELGKTIIVVSHNMEDVARYADRMLIMQDGKLQTIDAPKHIFSQTDNLSAYALQAPALVRTLQAVREATAWDLDIYAGDVIEALEILYEYLRKLFNEEGGNI